MMVMKSPPVTVPSLGFIVAMTGGRNAASAGLATVSIVTANKVPVIKARDFMNFEFKLNMVNTFPAASSHTIQQ